MAVMSDAQRQELWASFMQEVVLGDVYTLTKADLRAAVNALDQFLSDNASAINLAIPQPARSALSTSQKARLLVYVIRQRYLVGA